MSRRRILSERDLPPEVVAELDRNPSVRGASERLTAGRSLLAASGVAFEPDPRFTLRVKAAPSIGGSFRNRFALVSFAYRGQTFTLGVTEYPSAGATGYTLFANGADGVARLSAPVRLEDLPPRVRTVARDVRAVWETGRTRAGERRFEAKYLAPAVTDGR